MELPTPHPLFDHENFHFGELRQIIIGYVIHENTKECSIDIAEVQKCRLVCSDWLQITSQVLRQCRKPLFYLMFDKEHALTGNGYFNKRSRKLELNLMEIKPVPAPPVTLIIPETYPVRTIARQLNNFRNNLASLEVFVMPKSSRLLFPKYLNLPLLRFLNINFTEDTPEAPSLSLESVFNACPQLRVLRLTSRSCLDFADENVVLPADFGRVTFPETLQGLTFSKLEAEHMEILARSKLPNLKKLQLVIPQDPLPDGLFTRLLDNFKSSLEQLFINGDNHDGTSGGPRTCFRFPMLEKLDFLYWESVHLDLESGVESLETFLPKMTRIWILNQTPELLSKWTQSRFPSVTRLYVTMCDDSVPHIYPEYSVNLNEAVVRQLAHAFPNANDLVMHFGHRDYSALAAVWQEMTQLERLCIHVALPKHYTSQDYLTSGLLGVSLKMAADLRTKRAKCFQLGSNSIKQMSNLRSFRLSAMNMGGFRRCRYMGTFKKRFRMVSDPVFEMAFLQMPQLKEIFLADKFWASEEMMNKWKASGREMDCGACGLSY